MAYKHTSIHIDEATRLKAQEIAKSKGYIVKRGPHVGEGSIAKLIQAIVAGEATVINLGRK